jgi:hypothetical protein
MDSESNAAKKSVFQKVVGVLKSNRSDMEGKLG